MRACKRYKLGTVNISKILSKGSALSVFLPDRVAKKINLITCFCHSSRQERWQRGLFLLIFHDLYFVSSDGEINFSLGQKNCFVYLLLALTITTAKALYISQRICTKTGSIGVKEGSREFPIHTKTLENVTFQVTNIVATVGS